MGKKASAEMHHRCRVVLNIRLTSEERGFALGPGSVITHQEYSELVERGLASHDCFEDIGGEEEAGQAESEN